MANKYCSKSNVKMFNTSFHFRSLWVVAHQYQEKKMGRAQEFTELKKKSPLHFKLMIFIKVYTTTKKFNRVKFSNTIKADSI